MIVEWLIGIANNIVTWISTNLLTWQGAQPQNIWPGVQGWVSQFASIGVWINWAATISAIGLAIGVWLVCLGIKAVRALVSYVPEFGGAG